MNARFSKSSLSELDFSKDSRIKESLLSRIKTEYFGALDDDALDFLNAAGDLNEKQLPENDLFSNGEKLL
ncbi:MAG: hypothetical protein J6C75_02190 [Oscillospiraceae bacterium]|nr:hypothetical protein [Oscillospiraceae bacterium]